MNSEQPPAEFFERLFLRWQGKYPLRVVGLAQLLAFPANLLGPLYLWLTVSLTATQIERIVAVFAALILFAMALLVGYAALTTRTARAVLAGKQEASARAWEEMASLARRFVSMFLLANLLVVDLPLLASARGLMGGALEAHIGHLAVACFLSTVGWTMLTALVLDRALIPLQENLSPSDSSLPDFGLSWPTRLYLAPLALTLVIALSFLGVGYQRLVDVGGAGAQVAASIRWSLWQWIGLGVLALLLSVATGSLLSGSLSSPLRALKQALLSGRDEFSLSCYGSGEVSGLALGVRSLLERARAARQRVERNLQLNMAEVERHQARLHMVARIARLALMPQDSEALLGQVVRILANYYHHVALFWMEEDGRTLSLRVAAMANQPSPLSAGQVVDVDRRSVVGMAAYLGRVFLENEIRQGRSFQSKVTLPTSGAELAVPIRAGGRVTAVLDLQSERARDFTEEDLEAAEAIAAQLALVVQNQRLEEEHRAALRQVATLTAHSVRRAWESRVRRHRRGYRYTPTGLVPAERPTQKQTTDREGNFMEIPITLRGQRIGVISLARKGDAPWTEAERTLATEIAEQVALALENARLLADAQQRAAQEQMIGELTTRLSRSLEPGALLQAAVSELKRLPNVREVSVFIQPSESGNGSGRRKSSWE